MDLDKVTYLLALADTKNYSRAAEQCHISQPALTRYIKNLEEELNVTLLDVYKRQRKQCSKIYSQLVTFFLGSATLAFQLFLAFFQFQIGLDVYKRQI